MKILLAVHHFPPDRQGGAEWRAFRTARWLRRLGYDVNVVTIESIQSTGEGLTEREDIFQDIPVRRLSYQYPAASPERFVWEFRNPLIRDYLTRYIAAWQPDLMHLIGGYLMTGAVIDAALEQNLPVVVTLTDFWFICPRIILMRSDNTVCPGPDSVHQCLWCLKAEQRRYRWPDQLSAGLAGKLLRRAWQSPLALQLTGTTDQALALSERRSYLIDRLNRVNKVIAPSQFLAKIHSGYGLDLARVVFSRQGLDDSTWPERPSRQPADHLRIGYIGQLAPHKGVDVLLKAFKQLSQNGRQAQLHLFGNETQFPRFAGKLHELAAGNPNIIFEGSFDNREIGQIHARLDLLVVPSIWYENSPNVILEAFAAGTPVVASNLGGMAELVEVGKNGLLFESGDVDSLSTIFEDLLQQPAKIEKLREGIPSVKTVVEEMQELDKLYQTIGDQNGS